MYHNIRHAAAKHARVLEDKTLFQMQLLDF